MSESHRSPRAARCAALTSTRDAGNGRCQSASASRLAFLGSGDVGVPHRDPGSPKRAGERAAAGLPTLRLPNAAARVVCGAASPVLKAAPGSWHDQPAAEHPRRPSRVIPRVGLLLIAPSGTRRRVGRPGLGHWQRVERCRCEPCWWSDLSELSPAIAGDAAQRASRRCGFGGCPASADVAHVLRIVRLDARRHAGATVAANDGGGS